MKIFKLVQNYSFLWYENMSDLEFSSMVDLIDIKSISNEGNKVLRIEVEEPGRFSILPLKADISVSNIDKEKTIQFYMEKVVLGQLVKLLKNAIITIEENESLIEANKGDNI